MPFSTPAQLKQAIADWYQGDEIQSAADDLVRLAEAELNLRVRHRKRWGAIAGTMTIGNDNIFDLAPTTRRVIGLRYDQGQNLGAPLLLEYFSPEERYRHAYFQQQAATPRIYTLTGDTIFVSPTPSAALTWGGLTEEDIPLLSAGNSSNWLLELAPHLYLYACLKQAALFVQDDGATQKWEGFLTQAIQHLAGSDHNFARVGRAVAG